MSTTRERLPIRSGEGGGTEKTIRAFHQDSQSSRKRANSADALKRADLEWTQRFSSPGGTQSCNEKLAVQFGALVGGGTQLLDSHGRYCLADWRVLHPDGKARGG
jgi:hypothetical protein